MKLVEQQTSTNIYKDNNVNIERANSSSPKHYSRQKYSDTRQHFLMGCVKNGEVRLIKVPRNKMKATSFQNFWIQYHSEMHSLTPISKPLPVTPEFDGNNTRVTASVTKTNAHATKSASS